MASIEGEEGANKKHDCWAVACSDDGEVVVGGFSNGDIRMFDLRQLKGCLWGAELPGGIASLSLDLDESLVASTVQGGVHLWDLATKHPIHGYCRTDAKLEKSCVWKALPCPQADSVIAGALQSGALQIINYQRPDTRYRAKSASFNTFFNITNHIATLKQSLAFSERHWLKNLISIDQWKALMDMQWGCRESLK